MYRRCIWTRRKVWFTLGELEGCFTKETGLSCILRERFTKKRRRRPLGQRMQHGEQCIRLRWRGSSAGGQWWETKLASSESDIRPAVTLRSVDSVLQFVGTPRTGRVPVALKAEAGSCDCTGLIPTKPHSGQTVPKIHGAPSCGPPRLGRTSISPPTGCSWRRKLKHHFLWETLHGLSSQTILTPELFLVTLTLHIGSSQDSSQSVVTCSCVYLFIVSHTGLEAPWQQGPCVRSSSFVPRMVTSTKQDVKYVLNELKNEWMHFQGSTCYYTPSLPLKKVCVCVC